MDFWDSLKEAFKGDGKEKVVAPVVVQGSVYKGETARLTDHQAVTGPSNEWADCRGFNAVSVRVTVGGASPSATLEVQGSTASGGTYVTLPGPTARALVTQDMIIDVPVGQAFVKVKLTVTAGNFTVYVTPYVSAGQGIEPAAGFNHGAKTTNAGTAVQLNSDQACREVVVTAKVANTGYVYAGGSTVSSTSYGKRLAANDSVTIAVRNLNLVYVDVSVNGEGVDFLYVY